MKKTALALLYCAIQLSACTGNPQTQVKVIKPEIPPSLRQCQTSPAYPGDEVTQKDIAAWGAKLWYAHQDCRSKLENINKALGYTTTKDN